MAPLEHYYCINRSNIPLMDKLRAMATFVRIVETGSLTAAADALEVSGPSVVRLLASLERSLDVRLLNRTTRRIALTDEGRDYFERCKRILAEVEEAEAAAGNRRGAARGELRVTAPALFGRMHVAPLAAEFVARHAGVSIDLLFVDRVVNLLEEGLDAGVRIADLPDSSLVAIPVGEVRRVVCASPKYLARAGTPKTPQELRTHACIRFGGLGAPHEWTFQEPGRKLAVPVRGPLAGNQADALVEACADGLGIGMFLSYQVAPLVAAGRLKLLLADYWPPPVPVSVVYPHAKLLPARTRLFVDWLRERLPQRIAWTIRRRARPAREIS
ncbi:MAG TPA: LysR family transcriptional regulator [Burkholderiales bacterium]|nr:LysR family transcriptional regulator [Burkholderiales bacterium]